jgi:hypothetical protein
MTSLQLVDGKPNVIIENVKIDKSVFVNKYTPKTVTFNGKMPPELARR